METSCLNHSRQHTALHGNAKRNLGPQQSYKYQDLKTTKLTNSAWLAGSKTHLFQAKKQLLITCPPIMRLWEVLKAFHCTWEPFHRSHAHAVPHHFRVASSEDSSLHLA